MMDCKQWSYFKYEEHGAAIKAANGITGKTRLDCTGYYSLDPAYRGFKKLISRKGHLYFNKAKLKDMGTNSSPKRHPFFNLSVNVPRGGSFNLSGVWVDGGIENKNFGYGNPYDNETYSSQEKANPLFDYKNDLFLFVMDDYLTKVELFVVPEVKNSSGFYYSELINGNLEKELDFLRDQSKPLFNYIGNE